MDVALVTCAALPGLHSDDRQLLHALVACGVAAEPVVWEDAYQDWSVPRMCVIRSAWDYAYRRDAFTAWADRAAAGTKLWNPRSVVHWNTHKRYLRDLADRGAAVVPTVVLPAGSKISLEAVRDEHGWDDLVIKAAVAQSGRYIKRVHAAALDEGRRHLARYLPHEDMLIQPFLPAVAQGGELSAVFVEGEFAHAVRKTPAGSDFRVHDDYGGIVVRTDPTPAELESARVALGAAGETTLYARVDLVADADGRPVVMELELVEPELFLRFAPETVDRLAAAIMRRLED